MGLFNRSRSGIKWRCKQCDKVHSSNPEKCEGCGHTVLIQHNASTKQSSSSISSKSSSGKNTRWRCSKCGHAHERKPFVCDECGSSALREVTSSSRSVGPPPSQPKEFHPFHAFCLWTCFLFSAAWVYIDHLESGKTIEWIVIPIAFIAAWFVIWVLSLAIFGRTKKSA